MHQENDEYDIPSEQQIYSSFQSDHDISKLNFLANFKGSYENQHICYLAKYFIELDFKRTEPSQINTYAHCLYKLGCELKNKNPNLITKILYNLRNILEQIQFISEFHIAFLQSCIITYNYKLGYQFIKSKIFIQGGFEKKNNLFVEYFYFSGLIAQAQQDFDEALRCYKLANKFNPINNFSSEAQKMESLLCFRLGQELRNWSNPASQFLVYELSNFLQQNKDFKQFEDKSIDKNLYQQDQDVKICVKEWSQSAELYQFLQNEQEIHSKVSFDFILNHLKVQDQEILIEFLLQINKIHNMFLINEERRYIEFKYNNLTYQQINSKLEQRYNLLKALANIK
ncbi:unnamed protein product [Paramecium sonneborni]|uniref:Tetratricopeptide repeat protein n=1 Tax=Paramecium sonneborni TaxID=65129 RepID=A0A8S1MWU6_9CILI|nr:unnamed protein product [Paramecium sonneborni]